MKKALGNTLVLWIISLLAIGVQTAGRLGHPVAIPSWSGLNRILLTPWEPWAVLGLATVVTLVLAYGAGVDRRRERIVGWTVGLLGVASYLVLDAPLAVVLILTGRMIHGSPKRSASTAERIAA